jgi:hypothetical protein
MKKKKQNSVWQKVERDQALNVSELVEATGYSRASLRKMNVPLVCGKIPYSDFRRFLHKLQNTAMASHPSLPPSTKRAATPARSADPELRALADLLMQPKSVTAGFLNREIQAFADRFRAQNSRITDRRGRTTSARTSEKRSRVTTSSPAAHRFAILSHG